MGRHPPQFEQVQRGGDKAQRHPDTPRNPLPRVPSFRIGSPRAPSSRGLTNRAVRSAASDRLLRRDGQQPGLRLLRPLWSRRLSGLRNTLNRVPKGPLRQDQSDRKFPPPVAPARTPDAEAPYLPRLRGRPGGLRRSVWPSELVNGRAPPLDLAWMASASDSSPGPPLTNTVYPRRARAAATSAYRSTGQRFAPHPAPGLRKPRLRPGGGWSQPRSSAAGSTGSHGVTAVSSSPATAEASSTSCSITCAPLVGMRLRKQPAAPPTPGVSTRRCAVGSR